MAPRNSSTESVFHFSMAISSSTSPSSSRSFKTGSAPRRYLIVRVGKESAFPLLMNACSCGHRGNFHPQSSRRAAAYFLAATLPPVSSWQHFEQDGSNAFSPNWDKSLQDEQSKFAEENPASRHCSIPHKSAPTSLANVEAKFHKQIKSIWMSKRSSILESFERTKIVLI